MWNVVLKRERGEDPEVTQKCFTRECRWAVLNECGPCSNGKCTNGVPFLLSRAISSSTLTFLSKMMCLQVLPTLAHTGTSELVKCHDALHCNLSQCITDCLCICLRYPGWTLEIRDSRALCSVFIFTLPSLHTMVSDILDIFYVE